MHDLWNYDVGPVGELRRDSLHVFGFVEHVHFVGNVCGQLLLDGLEREGI